MKILLRVLCYLLMIPLAIGGICAIVVAAVEAIPAICQWLVYGMTNGLEHQGKTMMEIVRGSGLDPRGMFHFHGMISAFAAPLFLAIALGSYVATVSLGFLAGYLGKARATDNRAPGRQSSVSHRDLGGFIYKGSYSSVSTYDDSDKIGAYDDEFVYKGSYVCVSTYDNDDKIGAYSDGFIYRGSYVSVSTYDENDKIGAFIDGFIYRGRYISLSTYDDSDKVGACVDGFIYAGSYTSLSIYDDSDKIGAYNDSDEGGAAAALLLLL